MDADLKDFFGSAVHEKLMVLLNQRIADGRVLAILESIMKVGYLEGGEVHQTHRGVPQGGVISPLISNVLLTPFDREVRRKGYRLTRFADDWVVTCRTKAEAQSALTFATKVLEKLGVVLKKIKRESCMCGMDSSFLGIRSSEGHGL